MLRTTKEALAWDCSKCGERGFHGPRYCATNDKLKWYCTNCGFERLTRTAEQKQRNAEARNKVDVKEAKK